MKENWQLSFRLNKVFLNSKDFQLSRSKYVTRSAKIVESSQKILV